MRLLITILLIPFFAFVQQTELLTALPAMLGESSGLLMVEGRLVSINDSGGEAALYELDPGNGAVLRTVVVDNAINKDWEALTGDGEYIYIGDFGNNAGSRTDLGIYRISVTDYLTVQNDSVHAEWIGFSYGNQTDFTPTNFSTNFDAEAFVAFNDSLYIFSKNWGDHATDVYALPKVPGNHVAEIRSHLESQGLITDAVLNKDGDGVLLTAYEGLTAFVLRLASFSPVLPGTIERWSIDIPQGYSMQVEGIARVEAGSYYLSTEASFVGSSALYGFQLGEAKLAEATSNALRMYPNPATDHVFLETETPATIELYDALGNWVMSEETQGLLCLNTTHLQRGVYLMKWCGSSAVMQTVRLVLQ